MEKNEYRRIQHITDDSHEKDIKIIIYQSLDRLARIHKRGFFHRDVKLENLVRNGDIVKLRDFGLSREINSLFLFTDHISTIWYWVYEILLW